MQFAPIRMALLVDDSQISVVWLMSFGIGLVRHLGLYKLNCCSTSETISLVVTLYGVYFRTSVLLSFVHTPVVCVFTQLNTAVLCYTVHDCTCVCLTFK